MVTQCLSQSPNAPDPPSPHMHKYQHERQKHQKNTNSKKESGALRSAPRHTTREVIFLPISYRQYDDTNDLVKCACKHKHLRCLWVLMEYDISPLYPWDAIGPDFILDAFLEQDTLNMCPSRSGFTSVITQTLMHQKQSVST